MRFETVLVTPLMAAKFLSHNDGNRKLREQHAVGLQRAILEGRYKLTHQAAAITKRGRLIDGQHRFRAIVLANKAVEMVIAYDVPEDVYPVLDSGMPRKMYERLRSDPAHTSICTTLFRLMVRIEKAQDYELQTMLDVFDTALHKWSAIPCAGNKKGLKAPHMAAIVLRIASDLFHDRNDGVCRIQWLVEKIIRADLTGAPPIIHAFARQLRDGVNHSEILDVSPATDQFCRAWVSLDPEKEAVSRVQITDHSYLMRDARLEFKAVSQGVFD